MLFPVAIEHDLQSNTYGVVVPDLPGCFSHGKTVDEALHNAEKAIDAHLDLLAEEGLRPPVGSTVQDHLQKNEYEGAIWAIADVDVEPYLGKSHKINVTLPDLLVKRIDDFVTANPAYKTRSHFLKIAAIKFIEKSAIDAQNIK
jgi:predicted RNase H-like HicB family nuclease